MTTPLRLGTRGSPLALWQANYVADRLRAVHRAPVVELVVIQTTGDQVRDVPLPVLANYFSLQIFGLLKWWLDNEMPYTPKEMSEMFYKLVMPGVWPPILAGTEGR